MQVALNLALIVLSSLVLIKSVSLFIDSSSKIAQYLNLSGYAISFLLIGAATSFPELTVAVTSALAKKPILSYGDAIGSNIALLTLMTAIPGLMGAGISTDRILKSKDIYLAIIFALLVVALSLDKNLSRVDGFILITGYIIYFISFIKRRSNMMQLFQKVTTKETMKQFGLFLLSLAILVAASRGIVIGAMNLSSALGIKLVLIGLTITALGTNMPELAYIISERWKGFDDEVLGDIVGSVVVNTTLVLGTAAAIHPIDLNGTMVGISSFVFLILSIFIFFIFSRTKGKIERWEAAVLLLLYIAFIMTEFYFKN